MTVPKDEDLQDADLDEDDATLQVGLREAVAIAAEARDQGRTRKMSPITHSNKTTHKETQDTVKLLEDKELATFRSTLGRRRSKRKVLEHPREELLHQPFAGLCGDKMRVPSGAKLRSSLSLARFSCASCSSSESCARVARCFTQAFSAQSDHLASTAKF